MGDEGNPTASEPADNDRDNDGYDKGDGKDQDCDDTNGTIHPGAVENCSNKVDDNCDNKTDHEDPACKTDCTPGSKAACDCSSTEVDGTKTCSDTGTWGTCGDCKNPDADGDGHKATSYGGGDCNDNDASVHPGATDTCGDGTDHDCSGSDATCGVCTSGTTQSCGCPQGQSGGTQTCQTNGTWGQCSGCTTSAVCTPGTTTACSECPSGQSNGTKTCSASGQWGACGSCSSTGPTPCASVAGITEWEDITLVATTTETSTVRFMGMCGIFDSSTKLWTRSSDFTVIPGCETVTGSGTFTCKTRRPKGWINFEGNNYLNNGYWSVGVKTLNEAQAVCPSSYNSTTKTCTDLWSVMSPHGTYTINGTECKTSVNWVVNGNNDSFNCRI